MILLAKGDWMLATEWQFRLLADKIDDHFDRVRVYTLG
jgi:hypothetical protein